MKTNNTNPAFLDVGFWNRFCGLFSQTKKYLLLIEEVEPQHATVMQPIKEQRDALDHIVRAYNLFDHFESETDDDKKKKLVQNCQKEFERAKCHMERALNDCADILSIILREKISTYLSEFNYRSIVSVWKDYPVERKFLIKVDEEISKLRNRTIDPVDRMSEYDKIIERLKIIYYKVAEEIYPALC